jgi:hypothetical protein
MANRRPCGTVSFPDVSAKAENADSPLEKLDTRENS